MNECDCEPAPVGPKLVSFSDEDDTIVKRGRPKKDDSEITVSAGRKRAAELYPLDKDAPCEWQGLADAGGGKHPIIGCLQGKQQHIQHGPVKATYRNERENIHLICVKCHNRWHTVNDPVYDEDEYDKLPHSPRQATEEELIVNELNWNLPGYSKKVLNVSAKVS